MGEEGEGVARTAAAVCAIPSPVCNLTPGERFFSFFHAKRRPKRAGLGAAGLDRPTDRTDSTVGTVRTDGTSKAAAPNRPAWVGACCEKSCKGVRPVSVTTVGPCQARQASKVGQANVPRDAGPRVACMPAPWTRVVCVAGGTAFLGPAGRTGGPVGGPPTLQRGPAVPASGPVPCPRACASCAR